MAGTASAYGGTTGWLHAPLAITTVRQRISPALVVTWYPPPVRRTLVTSVPVRTGAFVAAAKRSMNPITSPMVM
ncbi:hypothetical protein Psuf_073970 [Phytohabitans suffuscus]|uniref:Uncharacterized protein n=1 Tax=Phytohabitans suffuscus TaxID=624315 RepID=A0A6F8YVJ9_9ACTN|nr:hypothetical protein [Phytohabitans suffuscus]BCB90084.1 hypothetical protein Psuf_073970 [Phytohabitans suffuscus]